MPTLHVHLDESGNLTFKPTGSQYYVFTAAWTYDAAPLGSEITALRFALLKRGHDLHRFHATEDKQLTLVIADAWQRRGIGTQMVRSAIAVARKEGTERVIARLSEDNHPMRDLLAEHGFVFEGRDGQLFASLGLR